MPKNNKHIKIKLVKTWKNEEIIELYKSGGWWKEYYDASRLDSLIKRSFAFAIAVDNSTKKAIGMGRVISDGVSDAYLQDIVILPGYRKKGIGTKIIKFLLDYCLTHGILWIGLIAEPNQDDFYSSLGFKTMKNYIPMIYQTE